MDEIAQNRQAICDFLNSKKPEKAANAAQAAIKTEAPTAPLQALGAIGQASLGQAWQQHPAKQVLEQSLPLAQGTIRQYPWLSLGAASALGAVLVLSPGLRRQAWRSLQGQLPDSLRQWL